MDLERRCVYEIVGADFSENILPYDQFMTWTVPDTGMFAAVQLGLNGKEPL